MRKKILLVKGGLDGHDRGILVVAQALRNAGLEVIYGGLYCSPEEIVNMVIEEDPDLIGISMLSGAHLGIFSEVLRLLEERTRKDWFLFGGGVIPTKDILLLEEMGVKKIFLPGADTGEIANFVMEAGTMKRNTETGSPQALLNRTKNGEILAASRLMTLIVRGDKKAKKLVAALPNLSKETFLIGITGPGGVGKSTLINRLIHSFREEGKTVGVVVHDPASLSGGAFLGDRIRMREHAGDQGVFIRSLGQYQDYKGVTSETPYLIKILGALKKEVIIIETVGVGQGNLGFKDLVEILIWVTAPGLGDEIQILKGGVIETADIIVVNQSDRPGVDLTFQNLLNYFGSTKKIYQTNSITGQGIPELVEGIKAVYQS